MTQSVFVTSSLDFKDETNVKDSIWSMKRGMGEIGKLNCFSALSYKKLLGLLDIQFNKLSGRF